MNFTKIQIAPKYLPLKNYHPYMYVKSDFVLETIGKFTNKQDIIFVALFGSSIKEQKFQFIKKSFLGFRYTKKVCITPVANDIDVLVVTRGDFIPKEIESKLSVVVQCGDTYGGAYFVTRNSSNLLHILISGENKIKEAIKAKDQFILNILKDAVLLEGNETIFDKFKEL